MATTTTHPNHGEAGPRETATSKAYAAIRGLVLNGSFQPGIHLKEEELAADLGVSRTPVRQALMQLVSEGMLQYVPNQGVKVRIWSREEMGEIFVLRAMLESHGAGLAAQRISDQEIEDLRRLSARMVEQSEGALPNRLASISETNVAFHKSVYRAAGSEKLLDILSNLIEIPIVVRTFRSYSAAQLRRSNEHHDELIAALSARDPDWASAIMRAHILSAKNVFDDRVVD